MAKLSELPNVELEQLARARKNPYYLTLRRTEMDVQLLNRWFNLGFGSREMAWFLLLAEVPQKLWIDPEHIQKRWTELHEQVCKVIFAK